ncbi:MAG: glycosyltransferase family 2 protein [Chloroflexota bacterium]
MTVIVPCYNEQATIGSLLTAVHGQTYPLDKLEVVVADGLSEDGTRAAIAGFREAHRAFQVRVVDNPKRTIPSGLNQAIRQARGDILVRLDAHSVPIPEYVERCIGALEAGNGTNVGGVWKICAGGPGWMAQGIAAAAAHPIGAGDALYRLGGEARAVDTVPFGVFRRRLLEKIGGFDETLLTNEDYEFNVRIRRHGGVVWLDPRISSTYVARATLRDLARQYWRYGYWKYRMLQRYPGSVRWRQVLPPLFVLALIGMTAAAPFWPPAAAGLLAAVGSYLLALLAAGLHMGWRGRDAVLVPGGMLALASMHISWGAGFLASFVSGWFKRHG